ncbi:YbaB/EbfC family nucleoid-associated protein [Actinokineospora auranticolor]|uniref:YbaB/EbfC DNA-binding family protein n=1 Tax=Actinokineospora auranticolor TaxID=155976 RepID=A0A2S6GEK2_9PSEU|nr:YbaB/EbfC family nucleoid-associated protein [Actinokineospora auranticolor]PPK63667.1 YbaB/EbfC DNA-binding family protein [Actinokineospora auranticolor]
MSGDPASELSAVEAMVVDWEHAGQERLARVRQVTERVAGLSVTEESGPVRVTVDSRGLPSDITLDESAKGRSMVEVSRLIMATLRQAQARLPELMERVAAEEGLAGDGVVSHLLDTARASFPEPDTAEPEPGSRRLEEDDFEGRTVFRHGD